MEVFSSNLRSQLSLGKVLVGFILEKPLGPLQVLVRLLQSFAELLCRHLACLPGSLGHLESFIRSFCVNCSISPVAGEGEAQSVRRQRRC